MDLDPLSQAIRSPYRRLYKGVPYPRREGNCLRRYCRALTQLGDCGKSVFVVLDVSVSRCEVYRLGGCEYTLALRHVLTAQQVVT